MTKKSQLVDCLIIACIIAAVGICFALMMNKTLSYKSAGILSTASVIVGTAILMVKNFKYSRYARWTDKYFPETKQNKDDISNL